MGLTIKGGEVTFDLEGGRTIRRPKSHGIIHDPDGKLLPRCVVFFGPYVTTRQKAVMDAEQREYFGSDYDARVARIENFEDLLAPDSEWKKVGHATMIHYGRPGKWADNYYHPFKPPAGHAVLLSKHKRFYRAELGEGCMLSWRGFISEPGVPKEKR